MGSLLPSYISVPLRWSIYRLSNTSNTTEEPDYLLLVEKDAAVGVRLSIHVPEYIHLPFYRCLIISNFDIRAPINLQL